MRLKETSSMGVSLLLKSFPMKPLIAIKVDFSIANLNLVRIHDTTLIEINFVVLFLLVGDETGNSVKEPFTFW